MGQRKTTLVFGVASAADLPDLYEPARAITRALHLDYGCGDEAPWVGFIVPEEDEVYEPPTIDLADLLAGCTPLAPRLAKAKQGWEMLRVKVPGLPEGRLLLVGDYEVA